jgi:hypothetical protein
MVFAVPLENKCIAQDTASKILGIIRLNGTQVHPELMPLAVFDYVL